MDIPPLIRGLAWAALLGVEVGQTDNHREKCIVLFVEINKAGNHRDYGLDLLLIFI